MVKDAGDAAEDKERRQRVELRNKADSLVYVTEKNVKDLEDKMSGDQKAKIEAASSAPRGAQEGRRQRGPGGDGRSPAAVARGRTAGVPVDCGGRGAEGGPAEARGLSRGKPRRTRVIEADYEVVDEEK